MVRDSRQVRESECASAPLHGVDQAGLEAGLARGRAGEGGDRDRDEVKAEADADADQDEAGELVGEVGSVDRDLRK